MGLQGLTPRLWGLTPWPRGQAPYLQIYPSRPSEIQSFACSNGKARMGNYINITMEAFCAPTPQSHQEL
jgi:hypothetical protein